MPRSHSMTLGLHSAVDDRIVGMELVVGGFVGLLDALDGFDDVERLHEVDVEALDVAHAADEGGVRADGDVRLDAVGAEPGQLERRAVELAQLVENLLRPPVRSHLLLHPSSNVPLDVERPVAREAGWGW